MTKFKVGQVVEWKAGGKVSRLDGVKGKLVRGTVTEIRNDDDGRGWTLTVRKHFKSIVPMAGVTFAMAKAV